MNKRIFISIIIVLTVNFSVKSQDDCTFYIQEIDSLVKAKGLSIYRQNKPSIDCELELLNYTDNKGYLGDSIEFKIKEILRYLAKYGAPKEIRERAINELLLRSYRFSTGINYHLNKSDFNLMARERLVNLLRKQYTRKEEERYVKHYTRAIFADTIFFTQLTYQELEKDKSLNYENTRDSIIAGVLEKYKNQLYNNYDGYSIHLPLLMGWLDMKECIPLLDSIQNVEGDISTMITLARLGNKQYQQFFMEQEKIDLYIAFYIGTQDLIAKYGEELYSDEKRYFIMGPPDTNEEIPIVYNVILELQEYIANFPQLIEPKTRIWYQRDIDALPVGVLEEAKRWMRENKGNYIISDDFIPDITNLTLGKFR